MVGHQGLAKQFQDVGQFAQLQHQGLFRGFVARHQQSGVAPQNGPRVFAALWGGKREKHISMSRSAIEGGKEGLKGEEGKEGREGEERHEYVLCGRWNRSERGRTVAVVSREKKKKTFQSDYLPLE